jgi:hypothetical protein
MGNESVTSKVVEWLKSPAGHTAIRALLAPSGVFGMWLTRHLYPGTDLGWLTEMVIQVAPFVIIFIIDQISSTKVAIINQVAKILADRQARGEPITPEVAKAAAPLVKAVASMPDVQLQVGEGAPEGAKAVASDPNVANVTKV